MIAHIGSGPEPNSVLLFDSCNWNVGLASFIYDPEFAYNRNQLLDILPLMHASSYERVPGMAAHTSGVNSHTSECCQLPCGLPLPT